MYYVRLIISARCTATSRYYALFQLLVGAKGAERGDRTELVLVDTATYT